MNMKKIILFTVLGFVVVVVAGGLYLSMNAGSMVKAGVETYGPQYTKTKVELGGVDASLLAGEITINKFLIGNPKGFGSSHAFKVDAVKVAVNIRSLTGDTIHIREIVIDAPDIVYELGGDSSNLQTIQKNMANATGGGKGKKAESGGDAKSGGDEGPRVIIDNLYIRNTKVGLAAGKLAMPLSVPDIHIKDIGKDSKDGKGATMSEAAAKVMDAITGSVTEAASKIDVKALSKQADDLVKGAGGGGKSITDSIKGLFGK